MSIQIHVIAPYEAMIPIIQECTPLFPKLEIQYSVGDLAKGVALAIEAEQNGTEIIISRGGTAQLIKKAVKVPVIDVQLSGYDMIRSLTLASQSNEKTAIVGFSNITSGAQAIIDLMDLPLKVYNINSKDEVASLILQLKSLGYERIVGDVVTFDTANVFGLNGFLIQSGKESIVKAFEEAQLVHRYLTKNDTISHLFSQLFIKEHPNIMILDEKNKVVFEHLRHFNKNPLSHDQIHLVNANLEFHKTEVKNQFVINDFQLLVTAYEMTIESNRFKVYVLEKEEISLNSQRGITAYAEINLEQIAANSHAMKVTLKNLEALYERNKVIHLKGDFGSGRSFIVRYIHQQLRGGGTLLSIDLAQVNPGHLTKISLIKVSNVEILHAEKWALVPNLQIFIENCQSLHIGVFVVTEQLLEQEVVHRLKLNTIIVPSLAERMDDIPILIQYFLTDYYHKYGTTAIKIKEDALKLIEDQARFMEVSDLRALMKLAALNEKEYVISMETLDAVLLEQQKLTGNIPLQGTLKEIEKEVIKMVLKENNNNQSKAAERLGINRATLWRKLKD